MPEHPDLTRLRSEYAERAKTVDQTERYSLFNPAQLFAIQQRQRILLKCLRRNGLYPLKGHRILEVGCGTGRFLLEALSFGADSGKLHGAELLLDPVQNALTSLPLTCADAQNLPYASASFDLTMQFTVFSSVLADDVKRNIASEMLRVTRPGGLILWYDFWLNPTNPHTRGIRPAEIRALFPGCQFQFQRTTLAPPLARQIVPVSWGLALLLESLMVFNTHYLVAIASQRVNEKTS